MKKIALLLGLFLGAPLLAKDLALEYFEKGNASYEKSEFDSAAAYYDKVLGLGRHDADVYFNLGNAHYRKNRLGLALLNYEKAKLLSPGDEDVAANLRFAALSTVDKIPPRNPGFLEQIFWHLHTFASAKTQGILVLAGVYLLSALFILWLSLSGGPKGLAGAAALTLLFFLAPLSASFFYKVAQEDKIRTAVVLSAEAKARNAPDGDQILFTVHEGAKFTLSRQVGEWYLAGLDNGLTGWVNEKDLGLVEIVR